MPLRSPSAPILAATRPRADNRRGHLFGLPHLGYAAQADLVSFGADVFGQALEGTERSSDLPGS